MSIEEISVPFENCGSSCAGITVFERDVSFAMNEEIEVWKPAVGFDGVTVSSLGRVMKKGKIKPSWPTGKGYKIGHGYMAVSLGVKQVKIHRLVATAFHPNPNSLPQINHINGITTDNRADNLEWCDGTHNIQHAVRTGLLVHSKGEDASNVKLTDEKVRRIYNDVVVRGMTYESVAIANGVAKGQVGHIVNGRAWKHLNLGMAGAAGF